MQYLLNEEEYNNLVPKVGLHVLRNALDVARDIIVGNKCIHSKESDKDKYVYCDTCQLSDFATKEKNMKRVICNLPRNYSK